MPKLYKESPMRNIFLGVFALCAAAFCLNHNLGAAPAGYVLAAPITGEVSVRADGDEVWVNLRLGGHHQFGTTLPRRAVRELADGSAEIRRQAGTIRLHEGLSRKGRFTFTPDPDYQRGLADRGLLGTELTGERLFELAMVDVTLEFIDDLAGLGYRESLDRLIEMRIHDAGPAYVRSLKAEGLNELPASRLVEMRIHNVRADDVRAWQQLGLGLQPPERLVEMAIHNVTPGYVEELQKLGVEGLTARRLVEMRIHGVDPDFVRDMMSLGYRDVPVRRWTEMRIHGVDGDYVRRLAKRGATGLSVGQLIERRIHGG